MGTSVALGISKKQADATRPWAHINHLTVLPEHRGRGVGKMLYREMLAFLAADRGWPGSGVLADLLISAVECNSEVLAWYERLGFEEYSRTTVYPSNCPVT